MTLKPRLQRVKHLLLLNLPMNHRLQRVKHLQLQLQNLPKNRQIQLVKQRQRQDMKELPEYQQMIIILNMIKKKKKGRD